MTTLIDPVCGMHVSESDLRVAGYEEFAFCAEGCRRAFIADPDRYVRAAAGAGEAPAPDHGGHDDHGVR